MEDHSKAISQLNSVLTEEQHKHSTAIVDTTNKLEEVESSLKKTIQEKLSLDKLLEESNHSKIQLSNDIEHLNHELEKERSATNNSQILLNNTIESLQAQIASKTAEIDQVRINSELTGDEMTQQINELQVDVMRAVHEKRVLEKNAKKDFDLLKEIVLRDKTRLMQSINQGQEKLVLALVELEPRVKRLQDMIGQLESQIKNHKEQNLVLSSTNHVLELKLSETKMQVRTLEKQIQDHSRDMQGMSSTNSGLSQNMKELEIKVTTLEKSLAESKETHSKLFEENKDLKCQNESLSNVATRYSQAIDTGNRQIQELSNDQSNTSQELERIRSDKIGLETEIRGHLSHISQLESDLNAAETEIRQMNVKLQDRCGEIEKFQGLYGTEMKLTESLTNEMDINKAEKCALVDSVKQLESECVTTADKLDELKQTHDKMIAEKENLEERITTLIEEKTVLIKSLDALSSEHQTVMEDSDAINDSNKKVIAKLELIAIQKQQTNRNILALKDLVQALKRENKTLKEDVEKSVKENVTVIQDKLQGLNVLEKVGIEVETLKGNVEAHKTANEELIEKNKALQKQVEGQMTNIENLERCHKELEQNLELVTKDKENIVIELDGVNEKLRLSQQLVEDKETELRELSQKIDETHADLVKKEGERNLFEIEVKKHEQTIDELTEKVRMQEKLVQERNENLEGFTEKLEKLTVKETSLNDEIEKLQETNRSLMTEVSAVHSEMESLRTSISTKESETNKLRTELSVLSQEKALLERDQKRIEQDRQSIEEESHRVKQELQEHQSILNREIASLNFETSHIKEENHKLQQAIFTAEQKLRESESALDNLRIKSQTELTELKIQYDNLQSDLVKAKENLEDIQNTINTATQQNIDLKTTNEKMRLDNETLIKSNDELQLKYVALREASSSKADIERLERQFKESDVEKGKQNEKLMEMFQKSQQLNQEVTGYKAKEAKMLHDINILNAKLHKHRDHSSLKEKELTEKIVELQGKLETCSKEAHQKVYDVRTDLEGRLQKMKEKMVSCFFLSVVQSRISLV